tara:strand:- start:193 stop:582 length:390 start_codon:yes stop_codon:yes gene_type:complete
MNEKIEQFNKWYLKAQPNDKYTYHTGNLGYDKNNATGYDLRQLATHILNICCKWDLSLKATKPQSKEPRFKFKNNIRLFQKVVEKFTAKKEMVTQTTYDSLKKADYVENKIVFPREKIFCTTEYYVVKL